MSEYTVLIYDRGGPRVVSYRIVYLPFRLEFAAREVKSAQGDR